MRSKKPFVIILLVAFYATGTGAAQAPVAVSPGSETGVVVESRCPSFSWGAVPGAKSYELVVYLVGEEGEAAEPVLNRRISGSALSWTPSLESCLERGGQYAWSVRAVGAEEPSEWSAPSLFEVAVGPSDAELERAVELVRGFLASRPATRESPLSTIGTRTPAGGRSTSPRGRGAGPSGAEFSVDGDGTVVANAFLLSCGEGAATTYHRDSDGDGLGDPASPGLACGQPSGYVTDGTDCNDADGSTTSCGTNQECSGAACICSPGFADCDGNTSDCETGTTSVENCGDCGVSCVDFVECTDDVCNGGSCGNPSSPAGTPCTGGECDGAGNCVPSCFPNGEACAAHAECCSLNCSSGFCAP
jgi:hypothetical protein